jgi:hypothetical protein
MTFLNYRQLDEYEVLLYSSADVWKQDKNTLHCVLEKNGG